MTEWPIEVIPDTALLYMRAHKRFIIGGELQPGVFRNQGDSMSVNWQKYCTSPSDSRDRARRPEDNAVISFVTLKVRAMPLEVNHSPEVGDRSHSDVLGEKTAEIRLRLLEIFEWCLRIGNSEGCDVSA
jgi:hypothetical protein